jgi:phosphohistidine phosphatase
MDRMLYVLRHAKSSWDDPTLDDQRRPLSSRGRRAAKALAEHLRDRDIAPELVLCSPARRTLETYERAKPAGELKVETELYDASAKDLLHRLRRIPGDVGSVMLIGHNPALQLLILKLSVDNGGATAEAVERKFPTGALASLRVTAPWAELGSGTAELVELVRPKDLQPGAE